MKKRFCSARLWYLLALILILICEVLIALYVRDRFVRPYGGDILVTVLLCCFVRVIFPERNTFRARLVPLFVFLFALCVELLQGIDIVSLLGLSELPFFRVLIGMTFSYADILCYAVGCVLFAVTEYVPEKRKKERLPLL